MAAQQQQFISLDSIIYDYINAAELSQNKYFRLFHIAFRGFENLGLDFFYHIKSVALVPNSNKTVTLPADFLQYNKIGILNGAGELVPLKYNDKLSTYKDIQPGRLAGVAGDNFADIYSYSSPVFFNFWNGSSYGNMYGVATAGISGGGFKIDNANGVILLDPSFGYDNLIMEYTASPTEGQDYFAPVQFREALIAWLAWQDIANLPTSRRGSISDKQVRRHDYFEARRKAIGQYRPFYLDQAYMNSQDATRLCIKS